MNSYHTINAGDSVYFKDSTYMGIATYKAIAHNGKCIGSVCVENDNNLYWIKGRCARKFACENSEKSWVFMGDNIEYFTKKN